MGRPHMRQLRQNAAQCCGHVFKVHLLGPLQKAPQLLFGGHVGRVFFFVRVASRNDSRKRHDREGRKLPFGRQHHSRDNRRLNASTNGAGCR